MTTLELRPEQTSELAAAIAATQPGASTLVVLAPGSYALERSVVGGPLTLIGSAGAERTVLRSRDGDDLFKIGGTGTAMLLRGLTLTGGVAQAGGALEVVNDAALVVEDCVLAGNQATVLRGGAVSVSHEAHLELVRCILRGNRAPRGGAVSVADEAHALVDRCYFADNQAEVGGALVVHDSAIVLVKSSTFCANTAHKARGGGALFAMGSRSRGPEVRSVSSLYAGGLDAIGRLPDRPAELVFEHCLRPPGTLAALALGTAGDNLECVAELEQVAPGLFALRRGAPGSGTADVRALDPEARDLRKQPLVRDGRADPGALAPLVPGEVGAPTPPTGALP
ncbi:MAG: hypothetical protein HY908_04095 [Myxococcales bacterium]|nr:hypothetical protein [Myxococcales bacterium]